MQDIISMTELQKLSLKKLRQKTLPLYVVDRKSKKGGFVIVDRESFEKSQAEPTQKITPDPNLFWNLKPETTLDPDIPSDLDMYIQQVLTRGGHRDVQTLVRTIDRARFRKAFERIKRFLPEEVRSFWEGAFGNH